MSITLGEKLRQAREARGVSISEVAEQTRISRLYLECIENDDYRTLPGGIFNKGFVKSFAKFVGVDEQEALQDYASLNSNQGTPTVEDPKNYRPEVLTDDRSASSSLPTLIVAAVILGLMTVGVLALKSYLQHEPDSTTNTAGNLNANTMAANVEPANTNVAPTVPAADEIKFELKPTGNPISVSYRTDNGKTISSVVKTDAPLNLNPQQNLTVSYYRGFTPDKVQITLNGKVIAAPNAPPKGNTTFEVTKENLAQILQSGQFAPVEPTISR
ncbi:MAG: helix-turn-helix domain-containing protein [Acidobacteriota bacterium]|nr:helix-turn-helix domain-containing protein [Acidobacteriota bacterium]